MPNASKNVALLIKDSMLRKGLELLITDMDINVVSCSNEPELEQKLSETQIIPDLLIFPLLTESNKPTIELIRDLRQQYKYSIPTIILSNETPAHEELITDNNIIVLPDEVKPSALRKKISESIACSIN
ncbi:MAG: hypothetical protein KAQ67_04445 [Gammaproteobacteria bacterium]|nr:hypothetical protein [Gammaproteobacteria bacterium]